MKRLSRHLSRRTWCLIFAVIVIVVLSALISEYSATPAKSTAKPLDFTVSGTNNNLTFFNANISICYVPFIVGADQHWQLTINCTQIPSGANDRTNLYIYDGYWDNGTNYKCLSGNLYPILSNIQYTNTEIIGENTFAETFNGTTTQQSYTVFFVFPNGGQGTFHITYKQI